MAEERKIKVALGQMDVRLGNVEANWQTARRMVAEAAAGGVGLIVLPELWSTGYDLQSAAFHAALPGRGIFHEVAALAREHRIAIVGSLLSKMEGEAVGNTAVYNDRDGRSLGHYSKIHLFRLMQEEQYLTAGSHFALVQAPGFVCGLAICYDLRFPEMFRRYALAGAEAVILPAEWPAPRLDHWLTLLKARAIENQMFVIACNRAGDSGDMHFFGHSAIVDPWGEFVIQAGEREDLLTAEIDLARVGEVRKKIPVFEDRRPELYAGEIN